MQRYPDIKRRFKRLIQLKRAALYAICQTLLQQEVIDARDQQLLGLADNMTLNLTFWLSYEILLHDNRSPQITHSPGRVTAVDHGSALSRRGRAQLLPRL